jgi:carbonic anhydrase
MGCTRIPRLALILTICLATLAWATFVWAQSAPQAKRKKAADDCKQQPFAYDNGPYGQGSWCGACNAEVHIPERRQAPINISGAQPAPLAAIQFNYGNMPLETLKNAANLKVKGQGSIHIDNFGDYTFEEFHFHRPSEEAIENHRSAMVIHLVHANAAHTHYAVVGVLVEEGTPEANTGSLMDTLINHFPPPLGPQGNTTINPEYLLPPPADRGGYFRFDGSLTTPPCTEAVTFFMLKTPIKLSAEQLRQFARRYPMPNARDMQPTHGREILERVSNK